MQKNWWKYLSAIILIYAIVFGLLRPLKPGILQVNPIKLSAGQTHVVDVSTYNTQYQSGRNIRSYLKINEKFGIESDRIEVIAPNKLKVTFDVPELLPNIVENTTYPIILTDPDHGAFIRPSAVALVQKKVNLEQAIAAWPKNKFGEFDTSNSTDFPFRPILYESIRNTFYHVPLWFGMVIIFFVSFIYAIRYLITRKREFDVKSMGYAKAGVLFGILGCVTGSIWARGTWGTWWTLDEIKLTVSAVGMLIYFAYFLLRSALQDEEQRGRVSAIYNIFAFVAIIPLLFVVPRMAASSLHPGNGGNPGLGGEDLDNTLRMVFYPAIIGWTLLGFWIANLTYRTEFLRDYLLEKYD